MVRSTPSGGRPRHKIAALSASTGNATSWNPNANNPVNSIIVSGSYVYTGGYFSIIGGQSRNYIARLSASTGNATTWNPNAENWLYDMALGGSTLYVAGSFVDIGGTPRRYLAAIDTTTGNRRRMNPNSNNQVHAISLSGSALYAGGYFTSIGGRQVVASPRSTPLPGTLPRVSRTRTTARRRLQSAAQRFSRGATFRASAG